MLCESGRVMPDEFTTESALLEWATGADANLKSLNTRLTFTQHIVFALCIALFFHAIACCLCPKDKPNVKHYRH